MLRNNSNQQLTCKALARLFAAAAAAAAARTIRRQPNRLMMLNRLAEHFFQSFIQALAGFVGSPAIYDLSRER